MELESDLDTEGRKSAQVVKASRKSEMRVKDLEMQLVEEKKANEKVQVAADAMQEKLRKIRLNLEAAVSILPFHICICIGWVADSNQRGTWFKSHSLHYTNLSHTIYFLISFFR